MKACFGIFRDMLLFFIWFFFWEAMEKIVILQLLKDKPE